MIDRILFGGQGLRALKSALAAYSDRARIHAENVANAETPGYRAREVRFEEDLRLALRTAKDGGLARTDGRHLGPQSDLTAGRVELRNPSSTVSGNGINDVEIDREMADIAANTMKYHVSAEMVARKYRGLKTAIRGRATG